ncbi:MAG TPA: NAD(P)/FAD-dependent oxidoreductase [Solirubrobacteraceae bacterium]|nr:NAD(P)/FAD-dependent oxidoreductase [Solirubrobacteraceae bacterium]
MPSAAAGHHDAIVVGAGHNGLVAATLLAHAGLRVLVLERSAEPGGAAVSAAPFPGHEVRLSRYSYLVSLFPQALLSELGIALELRPRSISSYTPLADAGVLISDDAEGTRASLARTFGHAGAADELERFGALTTAVARRVFPTMLEPLRPRAELERLVGDRSTWETLFERPLSEALERSFGEDLVRGIVATDALIGTFASLEDPELRQNRCFLYHVIGNGTGRWNVPVGGMGALSGALVDAAVRAGAELRLRSPVGGVQADEHGIEVRLADGEVLPARHLLWGAAPAVLAKLLGSAPAEPGPEGAQLKLNLLLGRLPRLRDAAVDPRQAFAGTFHVNEGYEQLQAAYAQAAAGHIPELPPCEAYCHSLTDASILSPELRRRGVQTLTVFGLHMPARLFAGDHRAAKRAAVAATLRSIDSVLAEPLEECLLRGADGEPCLEARTPVELEAELAMPGGHIFHRDLSWPFAEREEDVGRWGVETEHANVWLCGAGARRGGGVSGIPGHNAARAVLEADAHRRAGQPLGATPSRG